MAKHRDFREFLRDMSKYRKNLKHQVLKVFEELLTRLELSLIFTTRLKAFQPLIINASRPFFQNDEVGELFAPLFP